MTTLAYGHQGREPIRYWYVVALPAAWLAVMLSIWVLMGGFVLAIAGMPADFLTARLGLEGHTAAVAMLAVGIVLMGSVGLLQDFLRVPRRWAWTYAAGPAFGTVCWLMGMGLLWADVIFWGCIGLYAISAVLCLVGRVLRFRGYLAYRDLCKES